MPEKLRPGTQVWIPCEVKPGPFSNERSVLVKILGTPWVGFVDVRYLQDDIRAGETAIRGKVMAIQGDRILVALPGHPVDASRIRSIPKEEADRVPLVPVPA
jgi:hypothetical protein